MVHNSNKGIAQNWLLIMTRNNTVNTDIFEESIARFDVEKEINLPQQSLGNSSYVTEQRASCAPTMLHKVTLHIVLYVTDTYQAEFAL